MAHINQDGKKIISEAIKPILKKYGIKATLSIDNNSTINLNVKSGKLDFIENYGVQERNYIQVNPYHYDKHFTGECLEFLKEAHKALMCADWYNRTDIQSDYFDTAYYYGINIGKFHKPYLVI